MILSTPAIFAAYKTRGFIFPNGVGVTIVIFPTPATFAGIAFIKTLEGYDAKPPGT